MSTRSNIGIVNGDGSVKAIYCHFDGYPAYVGRILLRSLLIYLIRLTILWRVFVFITSETMVRRMWMLICIGPLETMKMLTMGVITSIFSLMVSGSTTSIMAFGVI